MAKNLQLATSCLQQDVCRVGLSIMIMRSHSDFYAEKMGEMHIKNITLYILCILSYAFKKGNAFNEKIDRICKFNIKIEFSLRKLHSTVILII